MHLVIDRKTQQALEEKIYGRHALELLYGDGILAKAYGPFLRMWAKQPFFSKLYGLAMQSPLSRKLIEPFIDEYQIRRQDFQEPEGGWPTFNDFFMRTLLKGARPLVGGTDTAIIPTDGRFTVFPKAEIFERHEVKGRHFSLSDCFQSEKLASKYRDGSCVFGRLCPVDYHRFHFCCDCHPQVPQMLPGPLLSVHPLATRRFPYILSENQRCLTLLNTELFGDVLSVEFGATNVGTILQTFTPHSFHRRGDEKGAFSFGGSALALFFPRGAMAFDEDLVKNSSSGFETLCQLGQSLGKRC